MAKKSVQTSASRRISAAATKTSKKSPTSKGVTKKPRASKNAVKPVSPRDRLADELVRLIPEIDAEGLLFLIRQANVLLHNKRVDELNAEMAKLSAGKKEEQKRAGTTARVGQNVVEITVEIQQSPDKKTYYLIVDGAKHFLTVDEMKAVVKFCFKPERKSDALRVLHQYLDNERKEILMDHGISSEKHPFFEALFYEVRRKFSLNE